MKKLPENQRTAREKHYEKLYLDTLKKLKEKNVENMEERSKVAIANKRIKDLEFFQNLTPEEMEDIKVNINKIIDFQSSNLGEFMKYSFMSIF